MNNESYVTGLRFKLIDLQSEAPQTALANAAHRTPENANSTFLLTEALGNLQFQGVLKSRYIAEQWLNMCGRVAFLILDLLLLSLSLINTSPTFGDGSILSK